MGKRKGLLPPDLIPELYRLLDEPAADYDCGDKCRDTGCPPFCCDNREAVPVLYQEEWNWLRNRTRQWVKFQPRNAKERKMVDEIEHWYVFAVCENPAQCDRHHRSFACRLFPLEPYLDAGDNLVGLVLNPTAHLGCYLANHPADIRTPFVAAVMEAWRRIFPYLPDEVDLFRHLSRGRRAAAARWGKKIMVFTPEGRFWGTTNGRQPLAGRVGGRRKP